MRPSDARKRNGKENESDSAVLLWIVQNSTKNLRSARYDIRARQLRGFCVEDGGGKEGGGKGGNESDARKDEGGRGGGGVAEPTGRKPLEIPRRSIRVPEVCERRELFRGA